MSEVDKSRAVIIAATITALGAILSAWIGVSVGRDTAGDKIQELEQELASCRSETSEMTSSSEEDNDHALSETQIGDSIADQQASGRQRSPDRSTSRPADNPVTTDDFSFTFDSCSRSGSTVRCELLITDLIGDRDLFINTGTTTDTAGNSYGASRFALGHEESSYRFKVTLAARVPTRMTVRFDEVRPDTTELSLFEVKGDYSKGRALPKIAARFRNIDLTGDLA